MRPGRIAGGVAALFLVLAAAPAAAEAPYPPGLSADTIRTATLTTAVIAAGGAHSCAITSLGDLYCWGDDSSGQLGDGHRPHAFGQAVLAVRGAAHVDAGTSHTCSLDLHGNAYCWGDDSAGQLGDGARTDRDTPVRVAALAGRNLVEISTGARHTCAVDDEGAAWCWGDGSHGQLGVPELGGSATPVRVSTGSGMRDPVVGISAGRDVTCATTVAGTAFCWGSDAHEQLGTAGRGDRDEPVAVALDGRIREIAAGGTQACAVDAQGRAFCWGSRARGSGTETTGPIGVRAGAGLRDIDAGGGHSCAFDTRGYAYCWGAGADGQLGTADRAASAVPVRVSGLPRPPTAATGVRLRALDGGLRVSWQPPADPGSGEFLYFWATTADYRSTCTLPVAAADGCELVNLENGREYDVAVLVRTRDGLTVSRLVTGTPAAHAPRPADSSPRRISFAVLPGGVGGPPVTGLSPIALTALGTLLLGGGLAALLVRRR